MNASPEIPFRIPTSGTSVEAKAHIDQALESAPLFSDLLEELEIDIELEADTTIIPAPISFVEPSAPLQLSAIQNQFQIPAQPIESALATSSTTDLALVNPIALSRPDAPPSESPSSRTEGIKTTQAAALAHTPETVLAVAPADATLSVATDLPQEPETPQNIASSGALIDQSSGRPLPSDSDIERRKQPTQPQAAITLNGLSAASIPTVTNEVTLEAGSTTEINPSLLSGEVLSDHKKPIPAPAKSEISNQTGSTAIERFKTPQTEATSNIIAAPLVNDPVSFDPANVQSTESSPTPTLGTIQGPGTTSLPTAPTIAQTQGNILLAKPADIPTVISEAIPKAEPGNDRVLVQLDPPELGRVTIDFKFDGQILQAVTITGETPEALRQLRHMHFELIQALEQNGLSSSDLDFRQEQSPQQQLNGTSDETQNIEEQLETTPSSDWPPSDLISETKLGYLESGLDIKV